MHFIIVFQRDLISFIAIWLWCGFLYWRDNIKGKFYSTLIIDLNFIGDLWKWNTLLKYIVKTTVKFSSWTRNISYYLACCSLDIKHHNMINIWIFKFINLSIYIAIYFKWKNSKVFKAYHMQMLLKLQSDVN